MGSLIKHTAGEYNRESQRAPGNELSGIPRDSTTWKRKKKQIQASWAYRKLGSRWCKWQSTPLASTTEKLQYAAETEHRGIPRDRKTRLREKNEIQAYRSYRKLGDRRCEWQSTWLVFMIEIMLHSVGNQLSGIPRDWKLLLQRKTMKKNWLKCWDCCCCCLWRDQVWSFIFTTYAA